MSGNRNELVAPDAGVTASPEERAVLARLLGAASYGRMGDEQAARLLKHFGTLRNVLDAHPAALEQCGLTQAQALLLCSMPAILRRRRLEPFGETPPLDDPARLADYVRALYTGVRRERFTILCLSEKRKLIAVKSLGDGTMSEIDIHPRLLLESVLRSGAPLTIFCHNHPNGRVYFSEADVSATREALRYLRLIGVGLIDHLLVAGNAVMSLRQTRYLEDSLFAGYASDPGLPGFNRLP